MRRVVPLLIVLCLGFAPAPAYRERLDPSAAGLKALQGGWRLVSFWDGQEHQDCGADSIVTIAGGQMTCAGEKNPSMKCTFTFGARPARLDRKMFVEGLGDVIFWGIYKVEGDTLTVCWSTVERPIAFGMKRADVCVEVYTRIKP